MSEVIKRRVVWVVGDRPEQAKEGWTIWNAPRLLFGTVIWEGPFVEGIFYAAVDPNDGIYTAQMNGANVRLAAAPLEYVSEAEVLMWVRDYCTKTGYKRDPAEITLNTRWIMFTRGNVVEREYTVDR